MHLLNLLLCMLGWHSLQCRFNFILLVAFKVVVNLILDMAHTRIISYLSKLTFLKFITQLAKGFIDYLNQLQ